MSFKINEFCAENELDLEMENKIKDLFIDMLLNKCNIQLKDLTINTNQVQPMEVEQCNQSENSEDTVFSSKKAAGKKPAKAVKSSKKFASNVAKEYAEENQVSLDDFDTDGKVTKNDIIQFLKKRKTTNKKEKGETSSAATKKQKVQTDKIICHGLTKTGEPCKTRAKSEKPDGAQYHYCPKHYENWNMFENQSDTEDEETDIDEPKEEDETEQIITKMETMELPESQPTEAVANEEVEPEGDEFEDEAEEENTVEYSDNDEY